MNEEGENSSKIYGNGYLGANLWEKSDLFQTDKYGLKFECLEMEEFLSENGLNENDVDYIDSQIQQPSPTTSSAGPAAHSSPRSVDQNSSNKAAQPMGTMPPTSVINPVFIPKTVKGSSLDINIFHNQITILFWK